LRLLQVLVQAYRLAFLLELVSCTPQPVFIIVKSPIIVPIALSQLLLPMRIRGGATSSLIIEILVRIFMNDLIPLHRVLINGRKAVPLLSVLINISLLLEDDISMRQQRADSLCVLLPLALALAQLGRGLMAVEIATVAGVLGQLSGILGEVAVVLALHFFGAVSRRGTVSAPVLDYP